ncbi:MAG: DUF2244 domain-containing protein [Pseudomonadota bacterium]
MIANLPSDDAKRQIFVVKCTPSLSWRGNVLLALSVGFTGVVFGMGLALQGYWLVLPFAGLEALVVLLSLRVVWRRLERREVITVSEEIIRVEWGRNAPERAIEFNRHWTRLEYHLPDSPFETGLLRLRGQGRTAVLGSALGREEKKQLHATLAASLSPRLSQMQFSPA